MIAGQIVQRQGQGTGTGGHRVNIAGRLAAHRQRLAMGDFGADPSEGFIIGIEALSGQGGIAGGGLEEVGILQPGTPTREKIGAAKSSLGRHGAGCGDPLGNPVQGGDRRIQARRPGARFIKAAGFRHPATLNRGQTDIRQRCRQAAPRCAAGFAERDLSRRRQTRIAEYLSPQQAAERLFTTRPRPAVFAVGPIKSGSGHLGAGGGFAK